MTQLAGNLFPGNKFGDAQSNITELEKIVILLRQRQSRHLPLLLREPLLASRRGFHHGTQQYIGGIKPPGEELPKGLHKHRNRVRVELQAVSQAPHRKGIRRRRRAGQHLLDGRNRGGRVLQSQLHRNHRDSFEVELIKSMNGVASAGLIVAGGIRKRKQQTREKEQQCSIFSWPWLFL
nr:hypothetical protein Iba_chr13dCG3980 [Ipomoea batatas]